jgi:hypothetical protein
MPKPKKKPPKAKRLAATPPGITGAIHVTDERAEWPVPPPHSWTTEESLDYKERLARGERVKLYRSEDGRTTIVSGVFYGGPHEPASAQAEARALLEAVRVDRRRLQLGTTFDRHPERGPLWQAVAEIVRTERATNRRLSWSRAMQEVVPKLPEAHLFVDSWRLTYGDGGEINQASFKTLLSNVRKSLRQPTK